MNKGTVCDDRVLQKWFSGQHLGLYGHKLCTVILFFPIFFIVHLNYIKFVWVYYNIIHLHAMQTFKIVQERIYIEAAKLDLAFLSQTLTC